MEQHGKGQIECQELRSMKRAAQTGVPIARRPAMSEFHGNRTRARGWIRTHAAVLILSLLLVIASSGWALTALGRNAQPATGTPVETVEVWVAARDMSHGIQLTRADVAKLTVQQPVPPGLLPSGMTPDDLVGRWLNRDCQKGRMFHSDWVSTTKPITLPDGMDLISFREPTYDPAIVRGSRIDVFLKMRHGDGTRVVPLMVDVLVLGNEQTLSYSPGPSTENRYISIAASQDDALRMAHAAGGKCPLQVQLRTPGADRPALPDMEALLQLIAEHVKVIEAENALPIAPAPRAIRPGIVLPEGMEIVSLPSMHLMVWGSSSRDRAWMSWRPDDTTAEFRAFPMLIDCQVLAVDTLASQLRALTGMDAVLLAVTKEEARLVSLAKSRGCHFDILLRHPGASAGCRFRHAGRGTTAQCHFTRCNAGRAPPQHPHPT